MNLLEIYRFAGPVDLKNVQRDKLLPWVVAAPLLIAGLFRWGVPPLSVWLSHEFSFNLTPYYGLLMSFLILMAPGMIGMVTGFLLLDERDDQTITALLVTPVPIAGYLFYRMTVPLIAGFGITILAYLLAGLAPLPLRELIFIVFVASFYGPITALFLATFAENKVSGFALVKVINTFNMFPAGAFFIDLPWQLMAGAIPAYWPMKMLWLATDGHSYALYGIIGLLINGGALALLLQRFNVNLYR